MSLANENIEQLFASAKSLPDELSLKEVELIFLNPAPLPPARPWYGSYLKFFTMLSLLLAAVLTVTVSTSTKKPILTAFPVSITAATVPSDGDALASMTIINQMKTKSSVISVTPSAVAAVRLPLNTAPSPNLAPAAAQKQHDSMQEGISVSSPKPTEISTPSPEKLPLSIDVVPGTKSDRFKQQLEETSTLSVPPLSISLPARKTEVDPLASNDLVSPAREEAGKKASHEVLLPVKWGLEQAGYMADTLKICSRNDRTCTMQLKLKGKFRLKLNPKMGTENMILYARPEAIAAMTINSSFRKMTLRNTLKDQAIDVEINPTALVGFRIKGNVELVDHEE